ncbi:MAG: carbonic anhydrase [Candidatus Nanosyncoccaceae bacterium]|jgi:carbonic anhydrase
MADLKKRLEKFKKLEYELNKDFYVALEQEQKPHTLFIGCSDSRVDVETLFQAKPGELFQIRNIANIVPRADLVDDYPSSASALEYAVKVLQVENIAVCGHSKCGGCATLQKLDEHKSNLPYVAEWLSQSLPIVDYVNLKYPSMDGVEKSCLLEKLNVVQQLNNLMTYDFIAERVKSDQLKLQAYYYDIGTGVVLTYDYENDLIDLVNG